MLPFLYIEFDVHEGRQLKELQEAAGRYFEGNWFLKNIFEGRYETLLFHEIMSYYWQDINQNGIHILSTFIQTTEHCLTALLLQLIVKVQQFMEVT